MADLILKGTLDLGGSLTLKSPGGKVKVEEDEVLVELPINEKHGQASAPVVLPPPPANPVTTGLDVVILSSLNKTVTANGKAIVAQGILLQGESGKRVWPGMVLPSQKNSKVTINKALKINVKGDQGVVFPSGGTATFDSSGQ
jgi:hypothetical protein